MVSAQGEDNLDHLEWVRIYNEVLEDVKLEMKVCGKEDSFWGATVCFLSLLPSLELISMTLFI